MALFCFSASQTAKTGFFQSYLQGVFSFAGNATGWLGHKIACGVSLICNLPIISHIIKASNTVFDSHNLNYVPHSKTLQVQESFSLQEPLAQNNHTKIQVDLIKVQNVKKQLDFFDANRILDPDVDLAVSKKPEIDPPIMSVGFDFAEDSEECREATFQILGTPGLKMVSDKEGVMVKDFDVEKLWTITALLTKQYPQAISPQALKELRDVDIEQYMALKLKRFGHVFDLEGRVSLPSGIPVRLDGFYEVFIVPMIASCYTEFSKKSTLFTEAENHHLCRKFNHAILSDFMTPKEVEDLVAKFHSPHSDDYEIIGTGFNEHSAGAVFFDGRGSLYALFCDQSGISTDPGIYVFLLPERELVTTNFITEISERADVKARDYTIVQKFMTDLNATVVHYEPLPAQTVGNCTYTSMQTSFLATKAIRHLLNSDEPIDQNGWRAAFAAVKPEHSKAIQFEQRLVFDDMMAEIEEWLSEPNGFGEYHMRQTYREVLAKWLNKYAFDKKTDHAMIERVKTLTQFLNFA